MFFFFNDTATTEIYTLSLHDALPIWRLQEQVVDGDAATLEIALELGSARADLIRPCEGVHPLLQRSLRGRHLELGWSLQDRKSTRLNSSHANISYAVFCLKKKRSALH